MRKYSTEAERGKEPWGKVSIVYKYRACFNVMAVEINVLQQVGGAGVVISFFPARWCWSFYDIEQLGTNRISA